MAGASPSLSLSDIMHPLSPPSTVPQQKNPSPPLRGRSVTPEPLELFEIEEIRRKVLAMTRPDSLKGKEKAGTREQELLDMVMRLTHPASLPQPSQLHAQAETIAHLIQQRDFLVKRSMEEQERWEAEREGWARAAQALIIHGHRESAQADKDESTGAQYTNNVVDASSQRMHEFERANVTLQNDKKALQQKLGDTQRRLASLESELAQLRPLLLVQPFMLTNSQSASTPRGWSTATSASRRRPQNIGHSFESEDESDDDVMGHQTRSQFFSSILRPTSQEKPPPVSPGSPLKHREHYRRPPMPSTGQYTKLAPRRKAAQVVTDKPVLSDARAEHLLLAARAIGRRRANILSGAVAYVPQPETTPKPKQKRAPTPPPKAHPHPPRTPRRPTTANTPLLTRTPLVLPSSQQPRTPLQSLLSAAQSVLSAPSNSSPTANESPLAKRRKLDPSATAIKAIDTPSNLLNKNESKINDKDSEKQHTPLPGGVARVKSALDFLADQAEAYSTQPPSQTSADSAGSPPKDTEEAPPQDVEMEESRDRTQGLERGQSEVTTQKSRSESVTPSKGELPQRTQQDAPALAPPIELTPRSSRSPALQTDSQTPRKRTRSHSEERREPPLSTTNSTTLQISSSRSPQPAIDRTDKESSWKQQTQEGDVVEGTAGPIKSPVDTPRRTRSPYVKWTKEEDEQLARAVAKHGQKWDLVQKALPSRGYHQVRQRWLRKLGVFEHSKLDLASLETNAAAEFLNLATTPSTNSKDDGRHASDSRSSANPKLGLAPLDSERAYTGSSTSRSLSPFTAAIVSTSGSGPGYPIPNDIANSADLQPHGE